MAGRAYPLERTRNIDGIAAAFAAILTVVTSLSLLLYLKISKSEDVRL